MCDRYLIAVILLLVLLTACKGGRSEAEWVRIPGGDPERGARLIDAIGCGACHTIPGIAGARGTVGPPLDRWSRRSYIAGAVPNSAENLLRWLEDPQSIEPGTAMPKLELSAQQARDVAAYLYQLD